MKAAFRAALWAAAMGAVPAQADTLIDNVNGIAPAENGELERFTGLLIGDDGRIEQVLRRDDKPPRKVDYRLDGKGRTLLPGLIASQVDITRLGFAILLAKPSAARSAEAMPNGKPRPEDRDVAFQEAQQAMLAAGITTAGVTDAAIEDWQSWRRAGDAGTLRMRLAGYAAGIDAMVLIAGPGPTPWLYGDRLKLNGVVLDAGRPVSAKGGPATLSDTQLRNLMSRAAMDRFQIAVRVTGPQAVGPVLDAIDELSQTYRGERRWRLLSAETLAPAEAGRAATQGLLADEQPALPASGAIRVAPFAVMAARNDAALSQVQALAGWTSRAGRALMIDGRAGRLKLGERADFILIDRDPTMAAPAELAQTQVLETWVDGKPVWRAGNAPDQGSGR